jgi:SAM-dependent methyltransferase
MALAGAATVVGLDIRSDLTGFATAYVKQNYPQVQGIVEFVAMDLQDYDRVTFDLIVSKDSFEHFIDLDGMLREMKKRLKPGGRIYAGFGPLYTSPYGDHNRRKRLLSSWGCWGRLAALVPWGHLFLESTLIDMHNCYRERKVASIQDMQLNGLSVSDYRRIFHRSGLSTVDLRMNQSTVLPYKVLSLLAKIPLLEDYCVANVYVIFENENGNRISSPFESHSQS